MKLNSIDDAIEFNRESDDRRKELALEYKWMVPYDQIEKSPKSYYIYDGSIPERYRIFGDMEDGIHGNVNPFNIFIYDALYIEDNTITRRYEWVTGPDTFARVIW